MFWLASDSGFMCVFPSNQAYSFSFYCLYQLYQKQERDAAILVRKQKTYAILDADDEDDDDGDAPNSKSSIETTKVVSHKKRFRKKTEDHDEDDEAK